MAEPPSTRPRSLGTGVALALILAGGIALRFWHLGTFSLWWDEIVHVWTAQGGTLRDVLREVKQGIPPGSGNAGAVPLDYLLLHLYLRLFPLASPDTLEVHFRVPAFVYGCAALPLLYALGRRFLDRQIALLATLLLATSIPHILYSAEARFYALFVLMTLANLYAFALLLERRDALARWLGYLLVNVLFFLAGLMSLLVIGVQYAVLGVLALSPLVRRGGARATIAWREIGAFAATSALLAAAVAAYYSGTYFGLKYRRSPGRIPPTLDVLWNTLREFSSDNQLLFFCLLLLPVPLVWAWRRRDTLLAFVLSLELTLLAIPVIVELARFKRYYFHPRHALFLLPAVEILTAITLLAVIRALDPLRWTPLAAERRGFLQVTLACVLVLATQLPILRAYVTQPERFFARSKKTHDLRAVTQAVRDAVAGDDGLDKYLLAAQRNVMANVPLAQYLRWYGLGNRVVLRGVSEAPKTLPRAGEVCATGCIGERGALVDRALGLSAPFGISADFQRLLGLMEPIGRWPGIVRHVGIVGYAQLAKAPVPSGWTMRRLRGVELVELTRVDSTSARASAGLDGQSPPSPAARAP